MSIPYWLGTTNTTYSTGSNWGGAAAPVAGDDPLLSNGSVNIDTSINAAAVHLNSFTHDMSYTGNVGTSAAYLQLWADVAKLGFPNVVAAANSGSQRLNLDFAAKPVAITLFDSARAAADAGYAPVRLKGSAMTLTVLGGIFCVGLLPGETSTLTALNMLAKSGPNTKKCIGYLGAGVTVNALTMYTGNLYSNITATLPSEILWGDATYNINGVATHTALNIASSRATVNQNVAATYTNLTVYGTLDLSQGSGLVVVSNKALFYSGSKINDPFGRLRFSTSTTNQVEAIPVVDTAGVGTFTLTIEGITTAAITYSSTVATLITNINAALNTTFGSGSVVASGASLAALILTFSGTGFAGRPITGHVASAITLTSGTFTINSSSSAGTSTTTTAGVDNAGFDVPDGTIDDITITLGKAAGGYAKV